METFFKFLCVLTSFLLAFPARGEDDLFIRTSEQAWRNLLDKKPDLAPLKDLGAKLESRKTIHISDELSRFFFVDPVDQYFPAEHEVVWFHIVAAMQFAQVGDKESVRVEVNRASRYLQDHFGDHAGEFDDPGLRALLALLWIYVGDWQHARVDLRNAAKMGGESLARWGALAEKAHAPRQSVLILKGKGPEVAYDQESELRYSLQFTFARGFSAKELQRLKVRLITHTQSWYIRHLSRDHALRQYLDSVGYYLKVAGGGVAAGAIGAAAILASVVVFAGAAVIAVGLVAGAVFVEAGMKGEGRGHLIAGALHVSAVVAGTGVALGSKVFESGTETSAEVYKDQVDLSKEYPYVRGIPSQFYGRFGEKRRFVSKGLQPILQLKSDDGSEQWVYFDP